MAGQDGFDFDGFGPIESEDAPKPKGPGRIPGTRNTLNKQVRAIALKRGVKFLNRMFDRAEKLEDEIDLKCAVFLGSRMWLKPRSAPVQIDLRQGIDAAALFSALQHGDLTAADAAALIRLQRNGSLIPAAGDLVESDDARQMLARELGKLVTIESEPETHNEESIDEDLAELGELLDSDLNQT